jgi:hypothetical protein
VSNSLAIAAVTRTIRLLLFNGMTAELANEDDVSSIAPDKARENNTGDQLNVFLYHLTPNAAWRNMEVPSQVRPGESGRPPLALTLDYLVTAYGEQDDEIRAHTLLGRAMSILHDNPLLMRTDIEAAFDNSGVETQFERVRITHQPLSLDDMYKLWSGFQSPYRASAAYQVSAVLIDSTKPAKAPLPVLRRGKEDRGVLTDASTPAFLSRVVPDVLPPDVQFATLQGDDVLLHGENLDPASASVRFSHAALAVPIELAPGPGSTPRLLRVHLPSTADDPAAPSKWPAGFYTVSVVVRRPSLPAWATNEMTLGLAPSIAPVIAGGVLRVSTTPQIRKDQRVLLLIGDRQVAPSAMSVPAGPGAPTLVDFALGDLPSGANQVVRLRVDGVDSIPLARTGTPPRLDVTGFDSAQKVTVP